MNERQFQKKIEFTLGQFNGIVLNISVVEMMCVTAFLNWMEHVLFELKNDEMFFIKNPKQVEDINTLIDKCPYINKDRN